jgi:hypothetical protein
MASSRVATGNDDYSSDVYVFEVPVRVWHWIHALAITVLAITGYLIANPLPSMGGEASDSFLMGNIRLIHFITAMVFAVGQQVCEGIAGRAGLARRVLEAPLSRSADVLVPYTQGREVPRP